MFTNKKISVNFSFVFVYLLISSHASVIFATASAELSDKASFDNLKGHIGRAELYTALSALARELDTELQIISNHDFNSIILNAFQSMQSNQKYYLIALLTTTVYNVRQLNGILEEIVYDNSEKLDEIARGYEMPEQTLIKKSILEMLKKAKN